MRLSELIAWAAVGLFVGAGAVRVRAADAPAPAPAPAPAAASASADEWVDPATGHRVVRLSRLPGASTGLYFHQKVYAADGKRMVSLNTPPGGKPRLCVYDFDTKQDEVILDAAPENGGFRGLIVAPKRREAFYHSLSTVYATNLDTKKTRVVGPLPEGWGHGAGFAINADETLLAGSFMTGSADVPPGTPKGEMMEKVFAAKLPNSLYTINIDTGKSQVIYTTDTWLGHVQFSPTDAGLLMFCHEGPWHKLDRIWTIRADGSGVKLIHQRKQPMEIAGQTSHTTASVSAATAATPARSPAPKTASGSGSSRQRATAAAAAASTPSASAPWPTTITSSSPTSASRPTIAG